MMYEYIEPHDETPSPYNDVLANNPEEGLHNLACFCEDYDEALAQSRERGGEFDIVMKLYMHDGSLMEIYVEPRNRPDAILTQLVVESLFGGCFKKVEAAAAEWDGTNPVRSIFDLPSFRFSAAPQRIALRIQPFIPAAQIEKTGLFHAIHSLKTSAPLNRIFGRVGV